MRFFVTFNVLMLGFLAAVATLEAARGNWIIATLGWGICALISGAHIVTWIWRKGPDNTP